MQNLFLPRKVNSVSLYFLIFILISISGYAQKINSRDDLLLIDSVAKKETHDQVKRDYIYKDQVKTFKNSNPVSLLFGGSLYVYQNLFSQHLSASCLYNPSCSDFGKNAVKEFGFIKGGLLSLDRLSRCNRIAATDLNPEEIDSEIHRFHDPVKLYK